MLEYSTRYRQQSDALYPTSHSGEPMPSWCDVSCDIRCEESWSQPRPTNRATQSETRAPRDVYVANSGLNPPKNLSFLVSFLAAPLSAGHGVLHVEVDRVVRQLLSPVLHLWQVQARARYVVRQPVDATLLPPCTPTSSGAKAALYLTAAGVSKQEQSLCHALTYAMDGKPARKCFENKNERIRRRRRFVPCTSASLTLCSAWLHPPLVLAHSLTVPNTSPVILSLYCPYLVFVHRWCWIPLR